MNDNSMSQLDSRLTRLETSIPASLERIENLLRQDIKDLKTDLINDLRKSIERLADDQRRIWEKLASVEQQLIGRINNLEVRESSRAGGTKAVVAIGHFFSAGLGGLVTWALTWLSGSSTHGH